jgi:dienelactone hydrolase
LRRSAWRFVAVAALIAIAKSLCAPASAEETVKFRTAALRSSEARDPGKADVLGYLTKPRGEGPFPAVVLLHSCLGPPANKAAIANMVASWGYVALFVDDFSTRGLKETCSVDFRDALADAFGALLYLSRLPYVDQTRIAAVGYSQGADTALKIASSQFASDFALPENLKFKVAAAFYPPCANLAGAKLEIPTLILVGEFDDVTPMADCAKLAQRSENRSRVKLIGYPGAYHLFDNPSFAKGSRLFGMVLKYDQAAAEESKSDLRDFLGSGLAR